MDKTKLYVGMIARDNIHSETILGLQRAGLLGQLHINRRGSPDNARNKVIQDFLKTDCTHLLFVDSDVVASPNIMNLLEFQEPVIAPLSFTILNNQIIPCVFDETTTGIISNLAMLKPGAPELLEADVAGCCWLVAREVYERCADECGIWHRQTWVNDDGKVQFGEDRYFFRLVRKHGYTLKIATGIRVGHMKTIQAKQ